MCPSLTNRSNKFRAPSIPLFSAERVGNRKSPLSRPVTPRHPASQTGGYPYTAQPTAPQPQQMARETRFDPHCCRHGARYWQPNPTAPADQSSAPDASQSSPLKLLSNRKSSRSKAPESVPSAEPPSSPPAVAPQMAAGKTAPARSQSVPASLSSGPAPLAAAASRQSPDWDGSRNDSQSHARPQQFSAPAPAPPRHGCPA